MGFTKISITMTAMITAAIIIMIRSGGIIPTAVITESSEKTRSSSMICIMTLTKVGVSF